MITLTLLTLIISITLVLSVLFLAGQLIRRRMRLAATTGGEVPPHRFLDDLSGLENALVDFFASSKVSSTILGVLAGHRKPIRFKTLMSEVRVIEERRRSHADISMGAVRAVLSILQFARLARMSRAGFAITGLGREVHRRMTPGTRPPPRMAISDVEPAPPSRGGASELRPRTPTFSSLRGPATAGSGRLSGTPITAAGFSRLITQTTNQEFLP